ncbi:MAG: hypothetical protein ACRENP_13780 [Longimicrobiales bacterium]
MKDWSVARPHAVAISGLALVHAIACWGLFRWTFSNTLARAETGRLPTEFEANIQSASNALMYPFRQMSEGPRLFRILGDFLPFILTSLLWGAAAYAAYHGTKQLVRYIKRTRPARVD